MKKSVFRTHASLVTLAVAAFAVQPAVAQGLRGHSGVVDEAVTTHVVGASMVARRAGQRHGESLTTQHRLGGGQRTSRAFASGGCGVSLSIGE
mgnify:CR=1 FL=1